MTVPQHETQPRKTDMEEETTKDHHEGGEEGEAEAEEALEGEGLNLEELQEKLQQASVPRPPDGGWGWVVVFASFMIHVFADGFTYTFGIYFVQLVQYYNATAAATSWIASILVGVTLGSGPIAGMFVNKFGCRIVTIAGALLATVALFVSIWAPNVMTLYFTIGLGAGFGFGLIYLPAIVCVTGYFEKRRSFATGIAVCGSGIGTFAFSPLIEYLISEYSWQNSLIIVSGLVLHCVFFGAMFRPLEDNLPTSSSSDLYMVEDGAMDDELPAKRQLQPQDETMPLNDLPRIQNGDENMKKNNSDMNLVRQSHTTNNIQRIASHGALSPTIQQNLLNTEVARMTASQPLLQASEKVIMRIDSDHQLSSHKSGSLPPSHHGSGLLYRKDIFYRGSLLNIPEYKQDPRGYRASVSRLPEPENLPIEDDVTKVCGCVPCSRETHDAMNSLMDWSLLSDGIFILFALSNFCTSIGFNAPYIFIVDRARHFGIPDTEASFLLAVVGISNTVSRILLGYISDLPWVNRLYLYNVALTICGLGTCGSIWFYSYQSQIFYAILFGSMSGAYVGLTSVVLVDLLGMEKLTNAFGLLLMFQGIASLVGPPMCGWLFDVTGTYDYSFLLAGGMIAISGLMLFFIPCIWRVQASKLAKKTSALTN